MAIPVVYLEVTCAEFSRYYSDFRDGNDQALAASMRWHAAHCSQCAPHARTMLIGSDVAARCAIEHEDTGEHSLSALFDIRRIA